MEQGLTTQQAVDKAGTMIDGCYKRWFNAPATMPVWGEEVDRQVWKFVEACRNVALGNLYWRLVDSSRLHGCNAETK